jgi:hypothetical protein
MKFAEKQFRIVLLKLHNFLANSEIKVFHT